jgi:hypothetical protein
VVRFESGYRRPDTVMYAAAKPEVVAGGGSIEIDLVGMFELFLVAVRGTPQQQQGGASGNGDAAKMGVGGHRPHVEPER